MKNLATYFGNPENKFKSIHIGGTNGKGTVSLKTARVLEAGGYKTGLFIGPHISSFRERISINCIMISKEDVVHHTQKIFDFIEATNIEVTFFEIVTMIAFLEFAEKQVEYAVLECGLGGRLDATNIIEKPEACAIASIGFDHMEHLGGTLELIAAEKAGIIKKGVTCVVGPTVTQESVVQKAFEMEAKLIKVTTPYYRRANSLIVEHLIDALGVQISQDKIE